MGTTPGEPALYLGFFSHFSREIFHGRGFSSVPRLFALYPRHSGQSLVRSWMSGFRQKWAVPVTRVEIRPSFAPSEGMRLVPSGSVRCKTCKSPVVAELPSRGVMGEEVLWQPVCPAFPSEHKEFERVTRAEVTIAGDFLPLGRCKECEAPLAVLMPSMLSGRLEPLTVTCSADPSHDTGVSEAFALLPNITYSVRTL